MIGAPALLDAVDAFADSSAALASGFVQYVSASDGAAVLAAACSALQAVGGGVILVGPGVIDNTATPVLGVFSGCNGVTILGYGTTIQNTTPTTTSLGYALFFTNCTNINVGGFVVTGTASATDIRSSVVKNQVFCAVAAGCVNVNFHDVKATGILTPFEIFNQDGLGVATTPIVRNVFVSNVQVTNCWYGMNGQYGPDGLVVQNLRTDTVHRSFFIYGATNVFAEIWSKDAWADDVLLEGFSGRGNSGVTIVYHSDETSLARSGALVALAFDYTSATPITHRNIRIILDVKFAGAGVANTGLCAFLIRKTVGGSGALDTTDRGHVLDGLDISGRIENYPAFVGFGIFDVDLNGKWGSTLDSWYNINIHDLHSTSPVFCRLSLAALKGTLNIENVDLGGELVLQQDNYIGAPDTSLPQNGRWSVRNSKFTNLRYFTAGGKAIEPIALFSSISIPVSFSGQTMSNESAIGAIMPVLPPASAGNIALGLGPMTFLNTSSAGTFRLDPDGTDFIQPAGAGKYLEIPLGGSATLIPSAPGKWQIVSAVGTLAFEP